MQDWELRDPRFEEIDDSEDDDEGVLLDPYALDPRARGFRGDELYFDGYDIGQDRLSRRALRDRRHFDPSLDPHELEYRDQRGLAYQVAVREKEEALIQSAMRRIARAQAKGKTSINLPPEEAAALQRREAQQLPEPALALASPPPTPAKPAKPAKGSSRTNSSTNLAKKGKKGSGGMFGTSSPASPAKSNSKAKVNRKPSEEQPALQALTYPVPAGTMIGPDGYPIYAPYGPPSPEFRRTTSGGSQPNSRSNSKHSRRESTPPERSDPYAPYPVRYYPPAGMRPPSSSSNRSLPDDPDWAPPSRTRSTSNAQYGYTTDPDAPLALPPPRRPGVSQPDLRYAPLRRVPAGSSPLAARPGAGYASYSDPAVGGARRVSSGLREEVQGESSSSSSSSSEEDEDDEEDEGVTVEILPDERGGRGYSVATSAGPSGSSGGGEARSRRGGRR